MTRIRTRRPALAAVVAGVSAALAACGSSDEPARREAQPRASAGAVPAAGSAAAATTAEPPRAADAPARRMYIPRIADAEAFEAFSKEIGNERFAKFVIDLKTDAIYYFDVTVYSMHKDFIFA